MYLSREDLALFAPDIDPERAEAMIEDAESQAILVAPCLAELGTLPGQSKSAVKSILRRAILRWHEVGTGGVTQETAGPYSRTIDTSNAASKMLFWSFEITALQKICREAGRRGGGAFTIDMTGGARARHSRICSINFGAQHCSCGSDLNRGAGPIFGGGC